MALAHSQFQEVEPEKLSSASAQKTSITSWDKSLDPRHWETLESSNPSTRFLQMAEAAEALANLDMHSQLCFADLVGPHWGRLTLQRYLHLSETTC